MGSGFEPLAPHHLTWQFVLWARCPTPVGLQLDSRLAPECPGDALSRIGHQLRQDMRLTACHTDLRVAEDVHHHTLIDSLGQQERGGRMPGRRAPAHYGTGRFQQGLPLVPVSVGTDRPPVRLAPHEVAVFPARPGGHAFSELRPAVCAHGQEFSPTGKTLQLR